MILFITCICCFVVSTFAIELWTSSGGYLTHDPELKLQGKTFSGETESYCYIENSNEISDSDM
jgi:hypothetical protein